MFVFITKPWDDGFITKETYLLIAKATLKPNFTLTVAEDENERLSHWLSGLFLLIFIIFGPDVH